MHKITVLIPGAGVDRASEVFGLKEYKQKFKNIGPPYHYFKSFEKCSLLILFYPEFSRQVKELYELAEDLRPNIDKPGIVLEFTESNIEQFFSDEGYENIFALVRSISPNKKKRPPCKEPTAPMFFIKPLEDLVKKPGIQEEISQLLYSCYISSYVS